MVTITETKEIEIAKIKLPVGVTLKQKHDHIYVNCDIDIIKFINIKDIINVLFNNLMTFGVSYTSNSVQTTVDNDNKPSVFIRLEDDNTYAIIRKYSETKIVNDALEGIAIIIDLFDPNK